MTSAIRGSVLLPLPIERAWDLWVDAARYPQWQSMLLAVRDLSGPVTMAGTTYTLDHGPKLKRHVRVLVAERPVRHIIEQTGMGVHDETTATFEPEDGGTRLTLVVHFHLNRVMRLLIKLDRRSRSERELQRELDRLPVIARRTPPPARVGGAYLAEAGTIRRRLTVLAIDPDRIHIRLHPGYLRTRDADDLMPIAPRPPSDQMDLWPINVPLRASLDSAVMGLPFLRRDGGHGIAHLALSLDAWADAAAREIDEDAVSDEDLEAVAVWRDRGAPTVGVDADLELAPICTFRLDADDATGESWAAAKVLRSEIMRIHLAIPAARWPERPTRISPRAWSSPPLPLDTLQSGDMPTIWPVAIGHYPLSRSTFSSAKPRFVGVATIDHDELEGYRMWHADRGGTFDSLAPVMGPGEPVTMTDLLTPSSGVSFGDRARVRGTPLTAELGLAGRIGTVHGHTTPSLAHTTDVVGESAMNVAVGLAFDDEQTVWIAAELVEFVDHGGGSEIGIGDHRVRRAPDGSWIDEG